MVELGAPGVPLLVFTVTFGSGGFILHVCWCVCCENDGISLVCLSAFPSFGSPWALAVFLINPPDG